MRKLKMADPRATRVSDLKPGQYADGSPLDDIQYLECKLILKTDEFTSAKGFRKYAKLVAQTAKECGVGFDASSADGSRPAVREVMFLDTEDFRLYNNAFILRRRVRFEDGFPAEEPEVVFKFRHPDQQQAAEVDVAPQSSARLPDQVQGRSLASEGSVSAAIVCSFSHNVQFPLSHAPGGDRMAMERLAEIFPALKALKQTKTDEGIAGQPDHRRGSASGPGHARLRQGSDGGRQRRALAHARRAPAARAESSRFRSSSSAAIRRCMTRRRERCAKFFIRAPADRQRLDLSRRNESRAWSTGSREIRRRRMSRILRGV